MSPEAEAAGLRYERSGSGPPLLLVHPLGAERGFWGPVAGSLSRERDVIRPDLPGFGESRPLPSGDEPTPRRLAAVLGALLDELGIERAHAGGSSHGAWVALELAVAGRALSVTAMCPSGVGSSRPPEKPPPLPAPMLRLLLRSRRFRQRALGHVMAHPERPPLDELVRFTRAMATAPGYDSTRSAMGAGGFAGWDELHVPVTLAWGEHDTQIDPIDPPRPGIRLDVLAGCGHVPVWDNPSEVERVLLETSGRN